MTTSFASLRLSHRSNERLANAFKVYMVHRPLVQRLLNVSFVTFILSSAYFGISGKSSASQSSKKGRSKKGKDGEDRPERVAVRSSYQQILLTQIDIHRRLLGRRRLFSASASDSAYRDTWD